MGEILTLAGVYKQFGCLHAIEKVSFSLLESDISGFLGPNGAGKTTTIRIIMNIIEPDSGSINFSYSNPGGNKSQTGYLHEERKVRRPYDPVG